jgi:hypothetical protein
MDVFPETRQSPWSCVTLYSALYDDGPWRLLRPADFSEHCSGLAVDQLNLDCGWYSLGTSKKAEIKQLWGE